MNKNKEFLQDCFLVSYQERVKALILSWYHKLVHHPSTSEVFDITYFEFDKNKVTSKEVYLDLIPLIEEGGLCECVTTLVYYLVKGITGTVLLITVALRRRIRRTVPMILIISGHTQKHVAGSTRIWYERLKVITLPRELVINET